KAVKIGKVIKETLEEVDIKPSQVNLSISGANVIVRFITMPVMSKEHLENAMVFEAEKYIPFNVNEVIMDFHILGSPEKGQMNVLLAAAKKDYVQSQIELMEKLGIGINVIDVNAFAVFNAYAAFNPISDEKGTAFVDFGYTQTNVLVTTGVIPRFMRLIQIGGKDIYAALAEDARISADEAEKKIFELFGKEGGNDVVSYPALTSVMDELSKEIQLSYGYFENKQAKPVGNTYYSGGMAYQPGVVSYCEKKLGIQMTSWNPMKSFVLAESLSKEAVDTIGSQFAVPVGLALRD
ncbi:MAG TPA: type IV pilus assembly protein PilM, partial [Candidatus Omnitrophota bacterium]|nr:type IV pilus assembly protein PilM [Candidatus Omnitrophota bacterium]